MWAANPELTAAEVAQILKDTAANRGVWGPELGYGVVDVAAAVANAAGAPLPAASVKAAARHPSSTKRLSSRRGR